MTVHNPTIVKVNRLISVRCLQTCAFVFCMGTLSGVQATTKLKADNVPFWTLSEGYWLSQNTYLDGNFDYKIKQYHSITSIQLHGDKIVTEEWKFYPPGHFYGKAIGLTIPEGVGVQFNQMSTATIINEKGEASVLSSNTYQDKTITIISPFTEDSALLAITPSDTHTNNYRMLLTYPTVDTRIVVNLGIRAPDRLLPKGGLRGASIFNGSRITQSELAANLAKLRDEYQISVVVTTSPDGHYISEALN